MQGRTFLRIMLDNLFVNNTLLNSITKLVNFYNEQRYYNNRELIFFKKIASNRIKKNDTNQNHYKFNSITGNRINQK